CLFICVVFLQTADSYSNELTFLAHPTPIEYLLVQTADSYSNELTFLAHPTPIEYLLVQVLTALPVEPQFTFSSQSQGEPFPPENCSSMGEGQDFHTLVRYLNQFPPGEFLPAMSNFHCLVFLATSNILPLKDHLGDLCTAIRNKNVELARRLSKSEQRCTVIQLMQAAKAPSPEPQGSGEVDMFDMSHSPSGAGWSCKHCTLMNQHRHENCDIQSQGEPFPLENCSSMGEGQ
ncbi:hypothetical protein pdam_00025439, partial [Pocillopora damicornis]